jgi:predicted oxidoreductase
MSNTNTGGPAFPQAGGLAQVTSNLNVQGMTLRDYFAAKAMQGMIAADYNWEREYAPERAAKAYGIADAMLRARDES